MPSRAFLLIALVASAAVVSFAADPSPPVLAGTFQRLEVVLQKLSTPGTAARAPHRAMDYKLVGIPSLPMPHAHMLDHLLLDTALQLARSSAGSITSLHHDSMRAILKVMSRDLRWLRYKPVHRHVYKHMYRRH